MQRISVDVTGSVGSEFVFRIPRGSLDAGNAEAVWRATITGRSTTPEFSIAETVGNGVEAASRNVGTVTTIDSSEDDYSIVTNDALDGSMFSFDADTGVISTVKGVRYDHEADSRREFDLRAEDGMGAVSTVRVIVNITDVDEPPIAPGAPTLSPTPNSETGIDASWTVPANAGRPRIQDYDLQYRAGGSGDWIAVPSGVTVTRSTIANLTRNRLYQVRVRANNAEGAGPWSSPAQFKPDNTLPTAADKTVTVNEDATWTADAADFSFSDSDTGDALAWVKITALPASGKGSLALDGTAIAPTALPKTVTAAELAADKLTYTPPADANGDAYATLSFKVNDGTADSAAAYTVTFNVTAVNDAATGLPTISGTARVGQVLTASVAAIADAADGLTKAANGDTGYAFAYQWLRVDGGTDTVITGATSQTYRLAAADEDKKLKVRVSFKDDDNHPETLTSAAYPADEEQVDENAAPTAANKTVTINEDTTWTAAAADFSFSDSDTGDALASVKITALPASGKGTLSLDSTAIAAGDLPQTVTAAQLTKLTYTPPANANGSAYATFSFKVNDGTDDSASAYTVTFNVTAVNDPATGLPTISGTARVGQTLTASTSAIGDTADGLTRAKNGDTGYAFAYQWLRTANGTDTVITGATASTYRLVAADQNRKLKVRVSFKDDDNHPETLTSNAYPADEEQVDENAAPTAANKTVTINEDTAWTAKAADFGFSDTDSGDALASVKITALPATGKGALALDGTAIAAAALPQTVTAAELAADKLTYTPPADANGDAYATFSFKVNDGTDDSAAAYTVTFNVTAVNDPATGLPAISGTARVGQTLTASTSAIADAADGLTKAANSDAGYAFAYQWLRVDGGTETAITGATASTYRLTAADEDKKLKVRVSFKDDDDHEETLTSNATATVTANENATEDGTLRLVDGETSNEGRIEMFYDGQWGSICDDYFTERDGDLTCKLVGYDGAAREMDDSRNRYLFKLHHFGPGTGPFWLDDLICNGDETSLLQCPRRGNEIGEHNCRHVTPYSPYTEDAGVRCAMTPRLLDIELSAPTRSDGRFHAGDTIELTLVWNMPVMVGNEMFYENHDRAVPPKVWLDISSQSTGESQRVSPGYVRGSGTARTVFAITLSPADGESRWKTAAETSWHTLNTLRVPSNSLTLRRTGMIRGVNGGRSADLTHAEHSWDLDNLSDGQVAAAAVVGLPEVTGPGADGAYATGDRIEARVVFDAPVTVDVLGGTPSLGLALGGVRREAPYASGSGTGTLVFSHEVGAAADGDGAAVAIANGIVLNGGTIRSSGGLDAVLDFGSAPGVSGVEVVPPGGGTSWSAGDSIEVEVAFAEPVEVDTTGGTPTIGISLSGTEERTASYARGSATDRLIFSYTLVAADGAASDVLVGPDTLALNGGTIRSTAGLDAVLTHVGGGRVIRQALSAPALSVADSEASEGETMRFRVTLEPASSGAVSVSYAAVAGTDYTATSGTLSFKAGDTEKTVEVPIAADALVEGAETFTLRLSDATGASVEDGEATGTVTDAVSETAPTATFSNVPARHDGESALTLELTFSGEPGPGVSSYTTVRDSLLEVTGGEIENASRKTQGSNTGWVLTVRPSGVGDVTLTLPVRACGTANAVCIGGKPLDSAATASIQGPSFTGSFDGAPEEHDGTAFTVNFRIGTEPDGLSYVTVRDSLFNVTGGSISSARRLVQGSSKGWELTAAPDGFGPVTLALEPTTDCAGTPGVCDAAGRMLEGPLSLTVEGPPTLSVADAEVEEADGATLDFIVTLSRALDEAVTVAYATSDGTATAGSDYTAKNGTLTFAAGDTTQTVSVAVLDDVLDDDGETMTMTLSDPSPSRVKLADAKAAGTITNTDLMPQAWTARFGRTVADQVLGAMDSRMQAARAPGVDLSLAGHRLDWNAAGEAGRSTFGSTAVTPAKTGGQNPRR